MISADTATPQTRHWSRLFWIVLLAVFLLRIGLLIFFVHHTDLAGDEAYYWDWGRRPDWGYYSKPPLIGWLMSLIGGLTGHAEWGIRAAALLFGTATLAVLFVLARRLYDAQTAFLAGTLMLLTPGNAGLNLFFTIDAPLLLAWSSALLLFWFAIEKPACAFRWLGLGLAIGFGALSKQMMLAFPVCMIAVGILTPTNPSLLKNPRFWLSMALGAAFLLPVLWWNQQHDWITVEHTRQHFDTQPLGLGKWLQRTLEFPAVQALMFTPALFAALLAVLWLGVRHWRQMPSRARFLLLFSAPPLIGFALLSLRQRINPNWPAVFYLPAFILAAAWMHGALPFIPSAGWKRWTLRAGVAFAIALHLALPAVFLTGLKGHKKLNDLRGWKQAGEQAGILLQRVPRPDSTFVLALGHRYHAARFAFYTPQHPRTYRLEASGAVTSQYEVWPGPETRIGDDAFIISPSRRSMTPLKPALAERFARIEFLGRIEVPLGPGNLNAFDVYLGHNLLHWNPPAPSPETH